MAFQPFQLQNILVESRCQAKAVDVSAESSDPFQSWQNTPWNLNPLTVISWQVSQDSYGVNEIRHQEIAGEHLQPKNFQIGLIVTCS